MLGRHAAMATLAMLLCAAPARADGPSCFDGIKNGPESDVDCGGDCPACDHGQSCQRALDCVSGRCELGECAENIYVPGEPVPMGYRLETAQHDGAANVRNIGYVVFGVSYAGAYVTALSIPQEMSWLFAPVLGPWLSLDNTGDDALKVLLVADGVLQGAGALFILGGIIGRQDRLVRNERATAIRVSPRVGPNAFGLSLGSVF